MKVIRSNQLLERPPRLDAQDTLLFGERKMPIDAENVVELTDEHTAQIEEEIMAGLLAFGALEQTLVMRKIGLPTLIARADCTVDPKTGRIHLYEAEERPAGMGVVDMIGQRVTGCKLGAHILSHLEHTLGTVPVVKRHPEAKINDDALLLPVEMFTPNKLKTRPHQPILVRAEPEHMTSHPHLASATDMAIAPIIEKGKRQYRVTTGHANVVTSPAALPENRSIVLKTLQGSKAKGVLIALSKADAAKHGSRDSVTHGKATAMIEREGAVLMERFVPGIPVEMQNVKIGHMILRVFCLIDSDQAIAIGGAYLARPGHLVHGSYDAVSGLIVTSHEVSANV